MNRRIGFLLFLLTVLASCKNSPESADTYFDSLIVAQSKYLAARKPWVTKLATMDSKKDQVTLQFDQAGWSEELQIFRRLALFERSSYQKEYIKSDSIKDQNSNLLIRRYVSKEDISIPEISFYYYKTFDNLKKIEATYQEGNALYHTRRNLRMEFDILDKQVVLTSYAVTGFQKMMLSDSVRFSVQSRITYP